MYKHLYNMTLNLDVEFLLSVSIYFLKVLKANRYPLRKLGIKWTSILS